MPTTLAIFLVRLPLMCPRDVLGEGDRIASATLEQVRVRLIIRPCLVGRRPEHCRRDMNQPRFPARVVRCCRNTGRVGFFVSLQGHNQNGKFYTLRKNLNGHLLSVFAVIILKLEFHIKYFAM